MGLLRQRLLLLTDKNLVIPLKIPLRPRNFDSVFDDHQDLGFCKYVPSSLSCGFGHANLPNCGDADFGVLPSVPSGFSMGFKSDDFVGQSRFSRSASVHKTSHICDQHLVISEQRSKFFI
ncbi:hypothetical protein CDAR_37461 [Caerostris darwini]|uniref:Uncharacterized protein n=1 Tax=Caerostris darwini TaxID=1538125 RepID=A0AAV4TU03_9ARAC|nr:hypothetical protein CDAR_37461 [Caerostris darwini]